jgi:hypothetical protein
MTALSSKHGHPLRPFKEKRPHATEQNTTTWKNDPAGNAREPTHPKKNLSSHYVWLD